MFYDTWPSEGLQYRTNLIKKPYKKHFHFKHISMWFQLGLAISGRSKPRILKELGIETQDIYNRQSTGWENKNEDDYYEDGSQEEEMDYDPLNWTGSIEIDAIIYPTMKGTLDIDQEGPLYILQGKLSLPNGVAVVNDQFEFIVNPQSIWSVYVTLNLIF